jgi:hypothetical protein
MDEERRQTSARTAQRNQFLKVLVPILLSCWVVTITTCLALCLKHQISVYWMLVSFVWGMLMIFSAASPRYVNPYMPMLLAWSFWFSIQTDIQLYWKLEVNIPRDMFLSIQDGSVGLVVQIFTLISIACLMLWIRRKASVFILAFISIVITTVIPKPAEIQVHAMILQSVLFCMLYFLSLAVSAVATLAVNDHRHFLLNNIVGSAWVLWVDELMPLIGLSALYVLLCLITLMARFDKVMLIWQGYDSAPRHTDQDDDQEDVEKRD